MRRTQVLLALLTVAAAPAMAADEGQLAFNNACRTCHSIKEGDDRLGPSLHGIVGKRAGSSRGYANHSQAMRSSGITWDEKTLEAFIASPDRVVPNNNMKPFNGIADPAVRKKIVAYLKSAS